MVAGILFLYGKNGNIAAVLAAFAELYSTIAKSEESMILTHTYVLARIVDGTTLTNDNVTCNAFLTTVDLNAKALAFGFAAVAGTTYTFFMSHNIMF